MIGLTTLTVTDSALTPIYISTINNSKQKNFSSIDNELKDEIVSDFLNLANNAKLEGLGINKRNLNGNESMNENFQENVLTDYEINLINDTIEEVIPKVESLEDINAKTLSGLINEHNPEFTENEIENEINSYQNDSIEKNLLNQNHNVILANTRTKIEDVSLQEWELYKINYEFFNEHAFFKNSVFNPYRNQIKIKDFETYRGIRKLEKDVQETKIQRASWDKIAFASSIISVASGLLFWVPFAGAYFVKLSIASAILSITSASIALALSDKIRSFESAINKAKFELEYILRWDSLIMSSASLLLTILIPAKAVTAATIWANPAFASVALSLLSIMIGVAIDYL